MKMGSQTTTIESRVASTAVAAQKRLPNSVLAMIIFVAAEIMFFAGLMSAHTIARATVPGGMWPPAGQPRLPVERTAFNTAILLLSGVLLVIANRRARDNYDKAVAYLGGAIATGIAFVLLQGIEWVALLREGLTMTSSTHGAFFYLIVGAHALHAVVAIAALAAVYFPMRRGTLTASRFAATQLFWYFVVLLWPVIYLRVYL
ncbi:MAG TPA: cytochrome c oxidase subunit 3 [Candidatus Acidoferrales bacterium]|nr:cytochrome c oxidase subunit 3 [Candidatus Acidoferrales bacterium]